MTTHFSHPVGQLEEVEAGFVYSLPFNSRLLHGQNPPKFVGRRPWFTVFSWYASRISRSYKYMRFKIGRRGDKDDGDNLQYSSIHG